ncbi:MAG TPA: pyridoxal 5'-phosphate synthase glutaminase subunit PdxT [Armatimonadetes bacterium]|nr:pyridoxal 5'-phosphate synthase glutaminase subunit PdxT [Armatimonadota bacterium]
MSTERVIGVLALQGDVPEHLRTLQRLGITAQPVRTAEEIAACAGLVIPGGESTTIGLLMERFGLREPMVDLAQRGAPILGTCAGMILLAKDIIGSDQPRLGLMDISVRRNAFGRQVDSFETDLEIPVLGPEPVRAVFIRAPYIEAVGPKVEALATFEGHPVFVRQGNLLAVAFHPELTEDLRVHQYFLDLAP